MPPLERPDWGLLESPVHGVRGKIHFARPGNRSVFEASLGEVGRIGQWGEDPGIGGLNPARQIDDAGEAVEKGNAQTEVRKGFDLGNPPGHAGGNLRL